MKTLHLLFTILVIHEDTTFIIHEDTTFIIHYINYL
jgi:hypothetical protein